MNHIHALELNHRRSAVSTTYGQASADSDVSVSARSADLTEAWRELLSRLPPDAYAALKAAMQEAP